MTRDVSVHRGRLERQAIHRRIAVDEKVRRGRALWRIGILGVQDSGRQQHEQDAGKGKQQPDNGLHGNAPWKRQGTASPADENSV